MARSAAWVWKRAANERDRIEAELEKEVKVLKCEVTRFGFDAVVLGDLFPVGTALRLRAF